MSECGMASILFAFWAMGIAVGTFVLIGSIIIYEKYLKFKEETQ